MIFKIEKVAVYLMYGSLCAFSLIIGCANPPSLPSRYEISENKLDGEAVSKNVILVADSHSTYLYGKPFWLRSELVDKAVSVDIRQVQQDLFGPDLLRWVLEYYGSQYPIIHLGDANNIGCTGEYKEFTDIMSTAKQPWVMVPGNHDAYLLGNTHINLANEWKDACSGGGEPMTKDKFIDAYLKQLQRQFSGFCSKYPNPDSFGESGFWRADFNSTNFLKSVEWKIDKKNPWRSYIVQEIDLSLLNSVQKVSAILLDTNQFAIAPVLTFPNAGLNGDIQEDQLNTIENWLSDDPTGKKITIFMGHHPFKVLLPNAKKTVDSLLKEYKVPIYISAHDHEGKYCVTGNKKDGWLELNVGSIIDWPIEFRTFGIHGIRDCSDKFLIRSKLFRIPECWDDIQSKAPLLPSKCEDNWEPKPGDRDYYISNIDNSSGSKKTQEDMMDRLLYTYKRLLENLPSAKDNNDWIEGCSSDNETLEKIKDALQDQNINNQISLLIALAKFDRNRKPSNSTEHRDYRLWQAVWASNYEKYQQRIPIPSDKYIIFTQETKK